MFPQDKSRAVTNAVSEGELKVTQVTPICIMCTKTSCTDERIDQNEEEVNTQWLVSEE